MSDPAFVWKQVLSSSSKQTRITPRWGHSMCPLNNRLLFFGGFANNFYTNDSNVYMNDLWSFDTHSMQWQELKQSGDIPSPRSNFSLNHVQQTNQLLLFGGGGTEKVRYNDTYLLDWPACSWKKLVPRSSHAPLERTYHTAETIQGECFVFGGEGHFDLDDLWKFSLQSQEWTQLQPLGRKPSCRRFHTSCKIGGCHSKYIALGEVFRIDLQPVFDKAQHSLAWEELHLTGHGQSVHTRRWGHCCSQYLGKIFIFGGRFCQDVNDLIEIDTVSGGVRSIKAKAEPYPRRRAAAAMVGCSYIIMGGFNSNYFDDMHYINLLQPKCTVPRSTFHLDRAAIAQEAVQMGKAEELISHFSKLFQRQTDSTPTLQLVQYICAGQGKTECKVLLEENPGFSVISPPTQSPQIQRKVLAKLQSQLNIKLAQGKKSKFNFALPLNSGFTNSIFSRSADLQVQAEGGSVPACSFLLRREPYFKASLDSSGSVKLRGWRKRAVQAILEYVQFDTLLWADPDQHGLRELLELSDYCGVQRLKSICEQLLAEQVNFANAIQLLELSIEKKLAYLLEVTTLFVAKRWKYFSRQQVRMGQSRLIKQIGEKVEGVLAQLRFSSGQEQVHEEQNARVQERLRCQDKENSFNFSHNIKLKE